MLVALLLKSGGCSKSPPLANTQNRIARMTGGFAWAPHSCGIRDEALGEPACPRPTPLCIRLAEVPCHSQPESCAASRRPEVCERPGGREGGLGVPFSGLTFSLGPLGGPFLFGTEPKLVGGSLCILRWG